MPPDAMNFEKMMSDLMGGMGGLNPDGGNEGVPEGMPDFSAFAKILG
jgi:hypothetical protein